MRIKSSQPAQSRFSQVPTAETQRSSFDRSHGFKTTFDSGYLVPIFVDEVLPGDTFNLRMSGFARLATPLHPFMDNLYMSTFFFFVPNRLLWDNWEKFNGAQDNPGDSTDFLVPKVTTPTGGWTAHSIGDYFGIPTLVDNLDVNALHFRAMNLIFNDWFRDENLVPSQPVPTDDGPDDPANYKLMRRGKRHDYFSSALPWAQKGPSVELPLGTEAPIHGIGAFGAASNQTQTTNWADGTSSSNYSGWNSTQASVGLAAEEDSTNPGFPDIYADLQNATAATINQMRQAWQIQRLYERDARGGTRYTEIVRSHFGVTSPDARLQRPEYLGGGTSPINIQPVPQTSESSATSPQANLAAYGTAALMGHGFTSSFTEHGVILGFVNVRADLTYQQGLNRMWSRQTRWDYYWGALSHIGEQSTLNKEIYAQGTAEDENVFGYQERYAEYRYKPSVVTGEFRSNFATPLDTWHLALDFSTLPTLSQTFIEDDPPVDRVIALTDGPQFLFDSLFNLRCTRPMPLYGVPGLVDHF